MGVYWAGSCPRPNGSERIPFMAEDELEAAFKPAEQLLKVSKDLHAGDELLAVLRDAVAAEFDADGPDATPVVHATATSRRRRAARLGYRGDPRSARGGTPSSSSGPTPGPAGPARRRRRGRRRVAGPRQRRGLRGAGTSCVVCGDSLRTPQLLFASGIRPRALGHYLNDHFQMSAFVKLHDEFVRDMPAPGEPAAMGSVLIPFSSGGPCRVRWCRCRDGYRTPDRRRFESDPVGQIGILAWYAAKDIQYRDAVEFSDTEHDHYGMPAMTIRYTTPTSTARRSSCNAPTSSARAKVVGELLTEPARAPGGSSLHYQGTVRMGLADDGDRCAIPTPGVGRRPPLRGWQRPDSDGDRREPDADQFAWPSAGEGGWPPSSESISNMGGTVMKRGLLVSVAIAVGCRQRAARGRSHRPVRRARRPRVASRSRSRTSTRT